MEKTKKEEKSKKEITFIKVANFLSELEKFTTVEDIAKEIGLPFRNVRAAIRPAKRFLASKGIIIINKQTQGYRVGTIAEFKSEVNKACKRSKEQMGAMANLINRLECSNKIKYDFGELRNLVVGNLKNIEMLFEDNPETWISSIPDFINERAHKEIKN